MDGPRGGKGMAQLPDRVWSDCVKIRTVHRGETSSEPIWGAVKFQLRVRQAGKTVSCGRGDGAELRMHERVRRGIGAASARAAVEAEG